LTETEIRSLLAREAEEAEAIAEAEDRGEQTAARGQRGRRRAADPSQVYSIRIPVSRLDQLRLLAESRGMAPTALVRQFVLSALDEAASPPRVATLPPRDPNEIRLGGSRTKAPAPVVHTLARAE
jgi:hypothetical protein